MDIPEQPNEESIWWVAIMVERFQFDNEDLCNLKRRCRAFTNTVILKAANREQAYEKEEGLDFVLAEK